jgi:hypothetical protein
MRWVAIDDEVPGERVVTERKTIRELRRCAYQTIARWLLSGIEDECPEATDGVSEQQAVMEDDLPESERGWHS